MPQLADDRTFDDPRENPEIQKAAAAMGKAIGRAERQVRHFEERAYTRSGWIPQAEAIYFRARRRAFAYVRQTITPPAEKLRGAAERFAEENALGVIAGVAAAAFAAGVLLRLWRSNRYE